MLYNQKDIERLVDEWGFLPFFKGEIEGFSIEEQIAPEHWFDDEDGGYGVWDWKTDIIVDGDCAYGKFYRGKACFVSMEWFPDLVNWRRSRYVPRADEAALLALVREHGSLLSNEMKKMGGYVAPPRPRSSNPIERLASKGAPRPKAERRGFDGAVTRLQMGGQLLLADFEYKYDRHGNRYGWSVARYCTPEDFFGVERIHVERAAEESRERIVAQLRRVLPRASEVQIARFVG